MKSYSRYEQTGSEWFPRLPEPWECWRLKYAASINDETLSESEAPDREIDYVDIGGVSCGVGITDIERLRFDNAPSRARRLVRAGDTLVSTVRTYLKAIAAIEEPPSNLVVSTGFAVVRPRERLCSAYLGWALESEEFVASVVANSEGVSYPAISPSRLCDLHVPVPRATEQRTIAAFLDHETARIDRLIEKQQRLIELLQEKRQAVISHTVTKGLDPDAPMKDSGVEWLGDVPAHWDLPRLKHIVRAHGGSTPAKDREAYWDGQIPWVSPKDMKRRAIVDSQDHITELAVSESGLVSVPTGAVLIVVRGMILAHSVPVAVTATNVTINQDMKALVPASRTGFEYLLLLLEGIRDVIFECIDSSAHGTRKLDWEDFGRLRVPLPPLKEQEQIVKEVDSRLDVIDRLVKRSTEFAERLTEHRTALISAAVTGKIDVRDWQPPEYASEAEANDHTLPKAAEERATYG